MEINKLESAEFTEGINILNGDRSEFAIVMKGDAIEPLESVLLQLLAIGWNKDSIFGDELTQALGLGLGFATRNLGRKRNSFILIFNWILRISNVWILLLGYNGRLHVTKKTPIES